MRLIVPALAALMSVGCASHPWGDGGVGDESPRVGSSPTPHDASRSQEVVLHALRFVGAPYRYGGNSPESGFDCSGLVWRVYQEAAGIALPREAQAISRIGAIVAWDELQAGDLVFFNTLRRPFSHVGIYVGDERFVHAPSHGGTVEVARMNARYWQSRFDGGRRIRF